MSAYGSPCGVGSSDDAPRVDDVAERGVGGLEQRRVGGDGDRLDGPADVQRQIELQPVGDADLDFARGLLEARQLDGDLIGAGNQVRRLEEADLVGHDGHGRAHRDVGDGDRRAGDDAAAGVADVPVMVPRASCAAAGSGLTSAAATANTAPQR